MSSQESQSPNTWFDVDRESFYPEDFNQKAEQDKAALTAVYGLDAVLSRQRAAAAEETS